MTLKLYEIEYVDRLEAENKRLKLALQNNLHEALYQKQVKALQARVEQLEGALPVVREFLWMALCYNDHNFRVEMVQDKCRKLCAELGIKNVDEANEWLAALGGDDE